ncbi:MULTISPECIES: cell division protein FtsQ/DivIB [Vagococcus]|uniref:cell division protein FtsQ/DivIB n=1 Tax=Vagococcus TaxID=2737 RepID=UPI002FC82BC9
MTDNEGQNRQGKQLLLTTESETKQTNEKPNKANEPISKLSFNWRYQQTKKEKELFKRLSIILSCLAIAIFVTLYFISPFSKVGKIVVSGVNNSDATLIVESSQLKVGKSLWDQYFNRKESNQSIQKENPRVDTANVQLKGVNTLQIKVKEFDTIGYVKKGKETYEVLSNGKFLKQETKEMIEGLPLLVNFEEGENLKEFINAYEQMNDTIKEKIETIESLATKTNPFRIKFKMKDGNEVIGLSTTIADKMAFYDKIVAEMNYKGVIDMEAGASGVFSSPFETKETKETEEISQPE